MMCNTCSELFTLKYYLAPYQFLYRRKARQLKATLDKCWMCKCLYDWLPGTDEHDEDTHGLWHHIFHPSSDHYKDEIQYAAWMSPVPDHPTSYRLRLQLLLNSDRAIAPETPGVISFLFIPAQGESAHPPHQSTIRRCRAYYFVLAAKSYVSASQLPDSTGSSAALDCALQWLNQCENEHVLCQAYSRILREKNGDFRPNRLIELLPEGIRLHETQRNDYRYVALTHGWPSDENMLLRLTASNYKDMLNSIPQSSNAGFSKVFADAVAVCRHMNIQYLWIDSLCIIQVGDERADWRRESMRMGDVYKYAVCTISASSIENPEAVLQDGMFRTHIPQQLEPAVAECTFNQNTESLEGPQIRRMWSWATKKSPKPGRYILLPEDSWHSSLTSAPIFKRGWVAQERFLSSRTLYFARDQIWFDCYEVLSKEVWPSGDPIFSIARPFRQRCIIQDLTLYKAGLLDERHITKGQKYMFDNVMMSWMSMTCGFAGLRFSKTQDKLLAVSGLAKSLMPLINATPEDYKAGMWVQSMPYCLLWYCTYTGRPEQEDGMVFQIRPTSPEEYQAPSWSWASINWPAAISGRWNGMQTEPLVSIESFDILLTGDDPFGQVREESAITLRGTTYSATLRWYPSNTTNVKNSQKFWPQLSTLYGKLDVDSGDGVHPDERFLEGITPAVRKDLRILPILRSKEAEKNKLMEALILEPARSEGNHRGAVYKRFGIAGIQGNSLSLRRPFLHAHSHGGNELITIL